MALTSRGRTWACKIAHIFFITQIARVKKTSDVLQEQVIFIEKLNSTQHHVKDK
jgi:hypothetical protein